MNTITKKDIVNFISKRNNFDNKVASKVFDEVVESFARFLSNGDRIEIRNFGVFETKVTPPRRARNPKTGGIVYTVKKYSVKFKAGKNLVQSLILNKEHKVGAV